MTQLLFGLCGRDGYVGSAVHWTTWAVIEGFETHRGLQTGRKEWTGELHTDASTSQAGGSDDAGRTVPTGAFAQ